MADDYTQVHTTLRADEGALLKLHADELNTTTAGVARAMLRFALEQETFFRHWFHQVDGEDLGLEDDEPDTRPDAQVIPFPLQKGEW